MNDNTYQEGIRVATTRAERLRRFGLTEDEYDLLVERQGGVCAICGLGPTTDGRRLAVDHDHHTGVIRGLLCTNCNVGIGNFGDNLEVLRKAIAYLEGVLDAYSDACDHCANVAAGFSPTKSSYNGTELFAAFGDDAPEVPVRPTSIERFGFDGDAAFVACHYVCPECGTPWERRRLKFVWNEKWL